MQEYTQITGMVLKAEPIGEYDRRIVMLTRSREGQNISHGTRVTAGIHTRTGTLCPARMSYSPPAVPSDQQMNSEIMYKTLRRQKSR